ncbi:hypothetical protein [Micromonospora marina]|uniref:hypothetical protein n=1 Tax=Micromonospora marina TaxID=307120 RepID=UPI003D711AA9
MAKRTKVGKLGPCTCSKFEVGVTVDGPDGSEPDVTIETTGCDKQTKRLFAQGHDAKLTSFLVRAEIDGKEVRYGRGEGTVITSDAVTALKSVSEALAVKAAAMLAKAQERAVKKAASKKTEPTPEPQPEQEAAPDNPHGHGQRIKVGRWTYPATVMPQGSAVYHTPKGERRVAEAGKWSLVEEGK